jgi:adenosylmethionine-8-amino-7-oxononanoate aminotransferase
MRPLTTSTIAADKAHAWHPFTAQDAWCASDPLVIERAEGVWLLDSEGNRYLDGNASIWTNIHGHAHPAIDAAIRAQLERFAHVSFLGATHPLAAELARRLAGLFPPATLERVFFSDDGSTAIECALKMAVQFRLQTGAPQRTGFIAFDHAYHGDTAGAASLGGAPFLERFRGFGFPVTRVANMEALAALPPELLDATAAVVIEPLIQGVNEMRPWPAGMLAALRRWCDRHGLHLILDEVMTGFGRTGSMFACQQEAVIPDFLCLAKGLTGGYLPLAATLTTAEVYDAFRGAPERAFHYGHSYTANPLGCAAALASLDLFQQEHVLESLPPKIAALTDLLDELAAASPWVYQTRQCGLIAGIELRHPDGTRFPAADLTGARVCHAARAHGLLTRPIRDTIVLLPPLAITPAEIAHAVSSLRHAIPAVLANPPKTDH